MRFDSMPIDGKARWKLSSRLPVYADLGGIQKGVKRFDNLDRQFSTVPSWLGDLIDAREPSLAIQLICSAC
ncbi:hypothetical protein M513_12093 [Trichuris suis]|uniref:Uncharacterized protein n=1 Tax=Trichuris suis TaxID=68888 RepID=A0A085LPW5_9BILA|nr:hypothetical protein M513_12093 [Trichuris suis]